MNRIRGSKSSGSNFDEYTINAVWQKGTIIVGYDANVWRKDSCGAIIKRSEYGNTNSNNGWEIDHIRPVVQNGTDDLYNLQPLQWENNRYKSDNFPNWTCAIKAA